MEIENIMEIENKINDLLWAIESLVCKDHPSVKILLDELINATKELQKDHKEEDSEILKQDSANIEKFSEYTRNYLPKCPPFVNDNWKKNRIDLKSPDIPPSVLHALKKEQDIKYVSVKIGVMETNGNTQILIERYPLWDLRSGDKDIKEKDMENLFYLVKYIYSHLSYCRYVIIAVVDPSQNNKILYKNPDWRYVFDKVEFPDTILFPIMTENEKSHLKLDIETCPIDEETKKQSQVEEKKTKKKRKSKKEKTEEIKP